MKVMFQIKCPADVNIIEQDTLGDNFYVLGAGACTITVNNEVVQKVGPGQSFGELALMFGCPRAATVRSTASCTLWVINRQSFQSVVVTAMASAHDARVAFLREKVTTKGFSREFL